MNQENVSATSILPAPAERVFAVLADPAMHAAIDGTGWVCEPVDTAPLAGVGQVFRMAMYHPQHPDGHYQTANQIDVLDRPRSIGWWTGWKKDGQLTLGGWRWRYDLTPVDPSTTEVILSYDWSAAGPDVRQNFQFPAFGPDHLANSLNHLAAMVSVR